MPMVLTRGDIVGKKIADVLTGPIDADPDGFSGCEAFVRLEDGTVFELIWGGPPGSDFCEANEHRVAHTHHFAVLGDDRGCTGDTILEVVRSECWPSIGLVLASGRFLMQADIFSPRNVRPCLSLIGEQYSTDDVEPFWGQGAAGSAKTDLTDSGDAEGGA